jgi:hypothetical protein
MSKTDVLTAEQETAEQSAQAETEQNEALVPLERAITSDMERIDRAESMVGRLFTRVGIRVDKGAFRVSDYGRDWRVWARPLVGRSDSILYKVRQAGAIARVLGFEETAKPEDLPGYLTLVPFYAVIKTAKTDKERGKAEDKIRRAWASLTSGGTFPTQEQAQAKADAIVGRIRQAQENGADTDPDSEETPQSGAEAQEKDSPAEMVRLDPAAVEATRKHLVPFFRQWHNEYGVEETAAKAIMSATLRLVGSDGPGRDLIEAAIG